MSGGDIDKALAQVARFKVIWWMLGIFMVALGFGFKTPAQHFDQIAYEIAILSKRESDLEQDHSALRRYVHALLIGQCIDRPPRDTRLMGIDCQRLIERGLPDAH